MPWYKVSVQSLTTRTEVLKAESHTEAWQLFKDLKAKKDDLLKTGNVIQIEEGGRSGG